LYTWPDKHVADTDAEQYRRSLDERREGRPIAYILGEREFWSLSLAVTEATLVPRVETETVVAWALELIPQGSSTELDLGTGCGAIALALASERPDWQVTAIDASEDALVVAKRNAAALGLGNVVYRLSDWFAALGNARFDMIVANPPYIDQHDPHLQRGDLPFEPLTALVAGDHGLADLAAIADAAPRHINSGGWLLLEHGFEQGAAVRQLLQRSGFDEVMTRCDLAGQERVTGGMCRAD
jgi:release factor glutamine methyltransferase